LNRSVALWNNMMTTMSNKGGLQVPHSSTSPFSQNNSMAQSQASFLSTCNTAPIYSVVSVKDDARDLLERYSQMMMEELKKKLSKKE